MSTLVVICTAAEQDAGNTAALAFDPEGGAETFTVGLNPTGLFSDPPTHYWCGVRATGEFLAAILAAFGPAPGAALDIHVDTDPDAILVELGLKRIESPYIW